MSTFDTLPVLLVSATSETVASSVILELIDNDVTEEYNKEIASPDRVWRLDNKYYSADIRVHVLTDVGILAIDPNSVEAQIIYITNDEHGKHGRFDSTSIHHLTENPGVKMAREGFHTDKKQLTGAVSVSGQDGHGQGVELAERRAGACCGAWARCHVRVLLAECAEDEPLEAWAVAQRADLVALLEEGEDLQSARDALHAHAWPNLRRKDARYPALHPPLNGTGGENDSEASSDPEALWEGEGEDEDEEEVRAVERAEAFAAALGALSASPPHQPPRAERLLRAEELVTAFCRALGLDPDSA